MTNIDNILHQRAVQQEINCRNWALANKSDPFAYATAKSMYKNRMATDDPFLSEKDVMVNHASYSAIPVRKAVSYTSIDGQERKKTMTVFQNMTRP